MTALFSLLGTIYGGDGVTAFALPDLRSRVPMHQRQGPGLSSRTIGESEGAKEVTQGTSQISYSTDSRQAR
jgi:microcystin-dependent protein